MTVRVTRPGAKASARTGYAAPSSAPLDRRRAIDAALSAPFAQQALRIDYTTYALAIRGDRARAHRPVARSGPARQRDRHQTADVVFVVRDCARRPRRGERHRYDAPAQRTDEWRIERSGHVPRALRAADRVIHHAHGRARTRRPHRERGSQDRRARVLGPDVTVSDLVLGSVTGALPVRATAFAEDGLSGMVETYGRAPDQLRALSVTASLVPVGSNEPAATTDAVLTDSQPAGGGVIRRASFALPLKNIAPGPYLARVRVARAASRLPTLPARSTCALAPRRTSPRRTARASVPRICSKAITSAAHAWRFAERIRRLPRKPSKGFDLFARGDYAGAATTLSDALKMDQTNAAIAFVLGWAYEGAGDHRQAIGAWRAAATIDPKLVPAHLAVADGYLRISTAPSQALRGSRLPDRARAPAPCAPAPAPAARARAPARPPAPARPRPLPARARARARARPCGGGGGGGGGIAGAG